jgi:diguanylate cyclase (GGDEF)-like protein
VNTNILLVDDNSSMIQLMGRILTGMGLLRFATSGEAALAKMRELPPDLVLLDAEMPGLSGYEVCLQMQADPALVNIPVIFVTAHGEVAFEVKGLEAGAVDFIAKPISEPLLVARVKTQLRIKALTEELRTIASRDTLTQLYNRRSFDEALDQEWRRCLRAGEPISILMIDVDHFKRFNDRYGHPAGDSCLCSVALALRSSTQRPSDFVARYGGEEFVILLPNTHRKGAQYLANRVLQNIRDLALTHEDSPVANHVTLSIGIGTYNFDGACWVDTSPNLQTSLGTPLTPADLVKSADLALYAAKNDGRDCAWILDAHCIETPDASCEPSTTS